MVKIRSNKRKRQNFAREFEGFGGFEELGPVKLIIQPSYNDKFLPPKLKKKGRNGDSSNSFPENDNSEKVEDASKNVSKPKKKKKASKRKRETSEETTETALKPSKKKCLSNVDLKSSKNECPPNENIKSKKKKIPSIGDSEKKSPSKGDVQSSKKKCSSNVDIEAWKEIFVPYPVLEAIKCIGFQKPSTIQKLTIPAAIKGQMDIIGAAETGSGKTLAFVIPIIHGILKEKEEESLREDEDEGEEEEENEEEGDEDEEEDESEAEGEDNGVSEDNKMGCVKVINNVDFDFLNDGQESTINVHKKKLKALIVTPTRELAVQIKKHTDAVLFKTNIKSAIVIGGLCQEKQERLLKKEPEIVIGTPGRLWELVQSGNAYLSQLPSVRYLAIDETDRMMEKGHFEELQQLLELINSNPKTKRQRQNFVFSATLTLLHDAPKRISMKKNAVAITPEMKIKSLMSIIGVREKPKIVDITQKFGTAQTLSESKILCDKDEKDYYLYYFLNRFPGRTLIFCNSIDCVRRLTDLLKILEMGPQSLHASKQQKQRLNSLERFTSSRLSVLLATDVAARGLDVPEVDHIIHFDVPRTAETYVHRSGRTARANRSGLSVLLVDYTEISTYRKIFATLNRTSVLPSFPIEDDLYRGMKLRVDMAREIEKAQYEERKVQSDRFWINKMNEDNNADSDDDRNSDEEGKVEFAMKSKAKRKRLGILRSRLKALLQRPQSTSSFSGRYPTATGKLLLPTQPLFDEDSISAIGSLNVKDKKCDIIPKVNKSKTKKKFKNKKKFINGK